MQAISLVIMVVLILYVFLLLQKTKKLEQQNWKLLQESTAGLELQEAVRHRLSYSTEIETIKFLRLEVGMNLLQAKQFVEKVKNA
ncbi:hypothetical protein A374_06586 [Fictibacillus macauensis ZFHKF-1]|uniref:50S ribosomal protein L7/L12 n=1 Tax=Fictibacillus macauensis ZFHKF-1 TaxID=1196324 RepID=I8UH67_9BACL|nr:hypothetical protein [Fictibacillus macauensis]EIT86245.1 hypothetical protein A374_06586 [Fictibacillus macauensis ZFHKF-1]